MRKSKEGILKNKPFISIVTACLNRVDFIDKAIRSVLQQDYEPYEHIIIDGGSTDGTLELLGKYPNLHVISEPDTGVYDAMEKGIQVAQGDIIGLLNSDDYYEENIFKTIFKKFLNSETNAVCGDAVFINHQGEEVNRVKSIDSKNMIPRILYGAPIINAWFFKRNFIKKLMPFNRNYPLAADRDLLIRAFDNGIRISNYSGATYYYLQHKGSLTINTDRFNRLQLINENIQMSIDYLNNSYPKLQTEMRKWFIYLSSEGMKTALRTGSISECCKYLNQVVGQNPVWLINLLGSFLNW